VRQARRLREAGESMADIVKTLGVPRSTLYRALAETASCRTARDPAEQPAGGAAGLRGVCLDAAPEGEHLAARERPAPALG
jgi:hypothetical protein